MKRWAFILIVAFLVGLGSLRAIAFLIQTPSEAKSRRVIQIGKGSSYESVVHVLDESGLVTSRPFFLLLGKLTRAERKIKPGEYALHTAMRPKEILDVLIQGKGIEHRVSFPEGYTTRQIAQVLAEKDLVDPLVFLRAVEDSSIAKSFGVEGPGLEGYLFPDTYYISKQTVPEEIIERMVREFQTLWEEEIASLAKRLGMSQREVVTLASMIEKETGNASERKLVAAVFHNRLKKRMRLQSDPTVIYPIRDFDGNITRKDLRSPTPYNTYLHYGLPPGPISNPGKASLLAAVRPAEVDYLYFVSKNDGSHYFSRTLKEHSRAVNRYQKRRRS